MKLIFGTFIMFLLCTNLMAQTTIQGKVTDEVTAEELIGANVIVSQNDIVKTGASTDFNGNYNIELDPGKYDVTVSYVGYPDRMITGVIVTTNKINKLNIQMSEPMGCIIICCGPAYFHPPLIDMDNTSSGLIITEENIQNSPFRDPKDLIINTPGVSSGSY